MQFINFFRPKITFTVACGFIRRAVNYLCEPNKLTQVRWQCAPLLCASTTRNVQVRLGQLSQQFKPKLIHSEHRENGTKICKTRKKMAWRMAIASFPWPFFGVHYSREGITHKLIMTGSAFPYFFPLKQKYNSKKSFEFWHSPLFHL